MTGQVSAERQSRWTLWLPLGLFAGFLALVGFSLYRPANRTVASAMVGKPLPAFSLQAAISERPGVSRSDFVGKPRLLNIFASWCVPCAAEAPQLEALRKAGVEVVGVAIRDNQADLERFLIRNGNPYTRIGADNVSAIQFAIGSSGVPESFVIDARGVIRYQHIGDISPAQVPLILTKMSEAAR